MKRCTIALVALILALAVAASPALAQRGKSGGAGKGPGGPPSTTPAAERSHGPDTPGPSSHATTPSTAGKKTPAELITHNTKLQDRLKGLGLADPGVACEGFKNLGNCVAAAHVSQNLGISFADLKARMLGTSTGTASTTATSSEPLSLGKAIQALDPNANATAEARKAQRQANRTIRETRS